jgi:hypothetical protein
VADVPSGLSLTPLEEEEEEGEEEEEEEETVLPIAGLYMQINERPD